MYKDRWNLVCKQQDVLQWYIYNKIINNMLPSACSHFLSNKLSLSTRTTQKLPMIWYTTPRKVHTSSEEAKAQLYAGISLVFF